MKGHTSQISRFSESKSKNIFFSLGQSDHTLIEWRIELVIDDNEYKKSLVQDIKKESEIYDETILRELNYSFNVQQSLESLKGII